MRLMRAVADGLKLELPGVKPALVRLIESMIAVDAGKRPASVKAVFEAICENEFAFFEGVDAVAVRVELAKFGVKDPFESERARLKRENIGLKARSEILRRLLTPQQELEFRVETLEAENAAQARLIGRLEELLTGEQREALEAEKDRTTNEAEKAKIARLQDLAPAEKLLELRAAEGEAAAQLELGEKLLRGDPERARALLRKCGLPKAAELLAKAALPKILVGSFAETESSGLAMLLRPGPKATTRRLGAWTGFSSMIHASFRGTAVGRARTILIAESANGKAIFGATSSQHGGARVSTRWIRAERASCSR
jgi:hypothetical protein